MVDQHFLNFLFAKSPEFIYYWLVILFLIGNYGCQKVHPDKFAYYHQVNRLNSAQYAEGTTTAGTWTTVTNKGGYSLHNLTYDPNGNIESLNRQSVNSGVNTIDALTYAYNGNQLSSVSDNSGSKGYRDSHVTGTDFTYDDNGNLLTDENQNISGITYNYLNLPERINKNTGEYILYVYDASGTKLYEEQRGADGHLIKRKDYLGEFVFENNELTLIHHQEGRIVPNPIGNGYIYEYDIKDHLGNPRVTVSSQTSPPVYFNLHFEDNLADDREWFESTGLVITNEFMDHTDILMNPEVAEPVPGDYDKSQLLTGAAGSRVGSILAIAVAKGDVVSATAFAKYFDPEGSDVSMVPLLATTLINAFTGTTGMTNEFVNQSITESFTGDNGTIIGTTGFDVPDEDAPRAYLNLLFLPDDGVITIGTGQFTFDQIDETFDQPLGGNKTPFDELTINPYEAPSDGYVLVYVSNEGSKEQEVYFDDIQVTLQQNEVVQKDDFYPFGLTFNQFRRIGDIPNRYLYQGNEQLENMDWYDFHARGYHPALGRFMMVDPQGQFVSGYVGMGNNPVMGVDPDGEFFFGTLLGGIARGITRIAQGDGIGGFFQGIGEGIWNGIKIDAGNFAWDSNLNFGENLLDIGSRFTWEAPQQTVGNLWAAGHNAAGQVDWVRYKYGATVVSSGIQPGGVTFGNYITGRSGAIQADENNPLFQHEYGHILQSRAMGFAYLWRVGLPSFADIKFNGEPYGDHDLHPVEQDANARAFEYFNKNIAGFYESPTEHSDFDGRGWNFRYNPVAGSSTYLDYRNPADLQRIRSSRIRPAWYDYLFPEAAGIYNSFFLYNP